MGIEGSLHFNIYCEHDRIEDVNISSSRPLQASRVFVGKNSDDVLRMMPMMYYVCAAAQSTAASMAFEQAMNIKSDKNTHLARLLLVKTETLREHLWRVLLDWNDKLGEEKDEKTTRQLQLLFSQAWQTIHPHNSDSVYTPGAFIRVETTSLRSAFNEIKLILETSVFMRSLEKWLEIDRIVDLQQWQQQHESIASRMLRKNVAMMGNESVKREHTASNFLPQLDGDRLHQCLKSDDADSYIAQPHWKGQVYETSCLSRQGKHPLIAQLLLDWGNGVATRIVARLVEIAELYKECDQILKKLSATRFHKPITPVGQMSGNHSSGIGMAQLEAARGRLIHRVELHEGVTSRYQIVAPTEWNFHPKGVAVSLLKSLSARDKRSLIEQADLLINSIDPCVSYSIDLH